MLKTEDEDGTIAAGYMSSLDIAVPMSEEMVIEYADKLRHVIFFYTTPEDIGLEEHKERWEAL